MDRLLEDWQHEYKATPTEYPISDNNRAATYDQFITLRDTLIDSKKYYADKAWRSLIIWTKLDGTPTDTIEIWEPNIMKQSFEPNWTIDASDSVWRYITVWWHTNPLSCSIEKKWRYKLQHKEQFNNISSTVTRIHSYIIQHSWTLANIERAVFDWEWNTQWEIKRLTAFGYVECDLNRWDRLELKIEDQWWNDISSLAASNSNRWTVEYIDLAYKL